MNRNKAPGPGGAIVQLASQRRDGLVNGAGQRAAFILPHVLQQLVPTEDGTGVLVKKNEQLKLFSAKAFRPARSLRRAVAEVHTGLPNTKSVCLSSQSEG